MSKINVLDSSVFNRIAAGEVVESPKSIVKELVENSIDAKAQNIVIEIKNGGIDYIRITDDGCGIEDADIEKAFLPHATSKITNLSDLECIKTLGFRGEALPSIASVSKVTITSRVKNADIGYCVSLDNGKKVFESEIGAPFGTTVTVESVFENVPARKKFLKKPAAEGAKIADLVQKLILANYNTSFKFICDGETIYHSSIGTIEQAVYTVYGDTLKNLDYVEYDSPDISIKGYVSLPSFSKHNKMFQTLIVNGRVVENEDISFYVFLCYQDYLMKRQYPMFVLYIDLPYDMIDVNVHPNKLNVKFSDSSRIKNAVMGTVKKSINKELLIPKNIEKDGQSIRSFEKNDSIINREVVITSDLFKSGTEPVYRNNIIKSEPALLREQAAPRSVKQNNPEPFFTMTGTAFSEQEFESALKSNYTLSGKIFNTYLIVEAGENVYFIDQHAAHEKILYDKLSKSIDGDLNVQSLLIPYVFDVSVKEKGLLLEFLPDLEKIGFSISQFGELIFSLTSIPLVCQSINLKNFVGILMEQIKSSSVKKTDFIKETVMQAACKSAVKGHDDLSKEEATILIERMIENGGALFCPHGRPIVVKLAKNEIEKWFKRIL